MRSPEMPSGYLASRSFSKMVNEALQFVRSATLAFTRRAGNAALSIVSWLVFAALDIADRMLCPVFAFLDSYLDSEARVCYCDPSHNEIQEGSGAFSGDDGHYTLESYWTCGSDGLYARVRRSGRTRFHLLTLHRTLSGCDNNDSAQSIIPYKGPIAEQFPNGSNGIVETILQPVVTGDLSNHRRDFIVPTANSQSKISTKSSSKIVIDRKRSGKQVARWSDCGCQRCTSWQSEKDQLLYVHMDDKDFVASIGNDADAAKSAAAENNVIFLHGFLSSSSFWADAVLPALPDSVRTSHRLLAVDILGFGRSPKPHDSLYTIAEHIDMIRRSVLEPYGIQSFHLVAHSMGCTIALALAAHYPSALKSITLIAPPYCPGLSGDISSTYVMEQMSARTIWPLITFGGSVMAWYEHVSRVVCFVFCKHHRVWEPLLLFVQSMLPGKRAPWSCLNDFTRHTHSSAWHNFHNTICNGSYAADHCFEVLLKAGKRVRVIHGTRDIVVPFKSSETLSERHPDVRLTAIASADHGTVVYGREAELAEELAEQIFMI